MKTPRTLKILRLMTSVIFSILHNEPLLLKGNLAQLDELGGIYIKFLQIVVMNLQTVNQEAFLDLLAVYERSKPDDLNIHDYLRHLSTPGLARLTNIESSPLGTGSFGQVYRATLDNHKTVIIKILRPSVMHYINYDLRLLSLLSRFYGFIDRQKMLNFHDIYSEFRKTCEQEVNYLREAEVASLFYDQYINHPHMVIPQTYLDLSTDKVIIQDYVQGLSLTDLISYRTQGINGREFVQNTLNSDLFIQLYTVGYELLTRALTGQIMHADPHPGNIVLLPNNKVALIDFGMTTQLTANRLAFFDLVKQYKAYYNLENPSVDELLVATMEFVTPKLYAAISSADKFLDSSDGVSLLDKLRHGATRVTGDKNSQAMINGLLSENRIMKALFFAVNKGNRFGLTIDLQAIILLKSTHSYMTLIGPFDPECLTVAQVLSDVVKYGEATMMRIVDADPIHLQPMEAMEILSNWFDKMSRNDPWLMQQIAGGYLE